MKKFFFMAATAALALSSCSSDELVQEQTNPADDNVINFGVYEARQTRAADTNREGNDQDVSTKYLQSKGFGVFAYEQGSQDLAAYLASSTVPNFMYNDHVTYADSKWSSEVAKYWPNNEDKVSFVAYAPYDAAIKPLFNVAYNGVGIRYSATDNKDLLWGCEKDKTVAPLNQKKPDIAKTIDFTFKHALNKVDINVSYNADETCTTTNTLETGTKITIRSVKLVGNIPTQGVLNLSDGTWDVEKTNGEWAFTTTDFGYTEGVGKTDVTGGEAAGVFTSTSSHTLYTKKSLMVIPPAAGEKVYLEITYDVESGTIGTPNYSCVTNTVNSKEIPTNGYPDIHNNLISGEISLAAGKWTTINVHLGMTSVKFTAEVKEWDDPDEKNIDMPANTPANFALVEVTEIGESAPTEDGQYGLDSNTVKRYSGSTAETSEDFDGKVVKAGDKYYTVQGSTANEISTVKTLYYKDGKYFENADFSDTGKALSDLAVGYYLISGKLYQKKSA